MRYYFLKAVEWGAVRLMFDEGTLCAILVAALSVVFSAFYRYSILSRKSLALKQNSMAIIGVFLVYLFAGYDALHLYTDVALAYCILRLGALLNLRYVALCVNFVWISLHYLYLSYIRMNVSYTVDVTVLQCSLVLRLIAISFDVYDGGRAEDKLHAEEKQNRLIKVPSLMSFFGYSFSLHSSFAGFFVPYRRYETALTRDVSQLPSPWKHVATRTIQIVVLGCLHSYGKIYFPYVAFADVGYLASMSFFQRMVYSILSSVLTFYRYFFIFGFGDMAGMITGVTYRYDKGHTPASKMEDIYSLNYDLLRFHTETSCNKMMSTFNSSVHEFVRAYLMRRLRFLGNQQVSICLSMLFLAIWHGLWPGYFLLFGGEFLLLLTVRDSQKIFGFIEVFLQEKSTTGKRLEKTISRLALFFLEMLCMIFKWIMGCQLAFGLYLLTPERFGPFYRYIYYFPFSLLLALQFTNMIARLVQFGPTWFGVVHKNIKA